MPCIVDTSYEDGKWLVEVRKHHVIVERILEQLIEGMVDRDHADVLLKQERSRFANAYEEIFKNLYRADALIEGKKKIMDGGP